MGTTTSSKMSSISDITTTSPSPTTTSSQMTPTSDITTTSSSPTTRNSQMTSNLENCKCEAEARCTGAGKDQGLITGLSAALAFSSCCCIALAVLAVYLYGQTRNKKENSLEPTEGDSRMSIQDRYVDNYYDSIQ